jgi:hypothetical protein
MDRPAAMEEEDVGHQGRSPAGSSGWSNRPPARPHRPSPGTPGLRAGPSVWPALAAARPGPGRLGLGPDPAAPADRLLGDEHYYLRLAAAEALVALGGHPYAVEGFSMLLRFGGSASD